MTDECKDCKYCNKFDKDQIADLVKMGLQEDIDADCRIKPAGAYEIRKGVIVAFPVIRSIGWACGEIVRG